MESGLSNVLKPRARGLVLLLLLAHAFLASATHFHSVARLVGHDSSGASLTRRDEGRKAPLANGEERCIVCRLQRNFDSGLVRQAAPEVAPAASAQTGFASSGHVRAHGTHTLSAKGRAPPLS